MLEDISVARPSYSQEKFHDAYGGAKNSESMSAQLTIWFKQQLTCSYSRAWSIFSTLFPVLQWLPKYKKSYIVGDLIAGWTVGIIRIPQGMAYALLAGVQPVYGLYSCFFPVLLWFVFSTSRHTSVGTMAVVCLMIQNLISLHISDLDITKNSSQLLLNGDPVPVNDIPERFFSSEEGNDQVLKIDEYGEYLQEQHELDKINLACSATLLVGIMQLGMALFRLGFLTTLLSDPVIQGFTTGAAFHVMTSQVKYLFGLDKAIGKYSGPFAMFKIYIDIFGNISHANIPDIIITLLCLPSLLIVKYLSERYKEKLRNIPIPIELILVVFATMVSYFAHLDAPPFKVNTVKTIPTGMPTVNVPTYLNLWSTMISDCLIMAFISVAISLSLTKIYADKHGYEIDANQEILALGICNTIPAFLSSFAVAASLSRTAIQESTGGKTQLVSILSSILMLIVLLWLAPLFQPVPKSVLACIIIVALKSLFLQFRNIKPLWSISKFDMVVWLVTCLAVIILGVDLGLAVGVAMAIAGLLYRIQHPKHALLGRIIHTDLYADQSKYKDAKELDGVRIFHFADSVSFTNKDAFRTSLYNVLGCNPNSVLSKYKKNQKKSNDDVESRHLIPNQRYTSSSFSKRKESMQSVRKRTNLPREGNVLQTLDACGLVSVVTHEQVFISVHDAATHAEHMIRAKLKRSSSLQSFEDMPGYPGYDSLAF